MGTIDDGLMLHYNGDNNIVFYTLWTTCTGLTHDIKYMFGNKMLK